MSFIGVRPLWFPGRSGTLQEPTSVYGLPADFDYSIFVGRTVEQVCFMENMVSLAFDERVHINIESSYSLQPSEHDAEVVVDIPPQESNLMQLAGQVVDSAHAEGRGTLILRFQGGHVFKCFDDQPMYESYHIVNKGVETHV